MENLAPEPSSHSGSPFSFVARFTWPRFYGAALIFFCVVLSWHALNADDDIWAHAAVGRWIWNHKAVPTHSLFLWSVDRFPWVAHSWLSQLFFHGLIQAGGGWTPRGNTSIGDGPLVIVVFTTLIICGVWMLLWRLWSRRSKPNSFVLGLFALGILAGSLRYRPRPELFTALFLTLLLCALVKREEVRREENRIEFSTIEYSNNAIEPVSSRWWREAFFLVILFALWANFHGAVALGIALLGITAFCDALQNRFDGRSCRFLLLFFGCVLATGLVPFAARSYWNGILSSTQSATFAHILEWQPLLPLKDLKIFAAGGVAPELFPFAVAEFVLAIFALLAWNANPQRRWSQAAWIVFMGILLLRQLRHMWLFALVCLAVMAANAAFFETQSLRRFARERFGRKSSAPKNSEFKHLAEVEQATIQATFQDNARLEKSWIAARLRLFLPVVTLLCLVSASIANVSRDLRMGRAVSPLLPDGACLVVEQQASRFRERGQTLHLFNDYENSSYLQWRLNRPDEHGQLPDLGQCPLFVDLLNAYPDSVVNQYLAILQATPAGQRLMQQYAINCVVLKAGLHADKLASYLNKNPQWAHLYQGKDGDVWMRRAPLIHQQRRGK